MTPTDPGPGCLPNHAAWPRPYVSLAAGPAIDPPGRRGDFTTHYEQTRAPVVRAAVWMFYRDQARRTT